MSYKEALERIKEAKETNATSIDLSKLNLKEIPKKLFESTNLIELSLHNNQITQLPKEIAQLTSLTKLYLYNNQITQTPKEIGNLINEPISKVQSCEKIEQNL